VAWPLFGPSFDYLVGANQDIVSGTVTPRAFAVSKLTIVKYLTGDGKFRRLCSPKNSVYIASSTMEYISEIRSIGNQAAISGAVRRMIDCRRKTADESGPKDVVADCDNRDSPCRLLDYSGREIADRGDDIDLKADQLGSEVGELLRSSLGIAKLDRDVPTFNITNPTGLAPSETTPYVAKRAAMLRATARRFW
jgi:hypothetical protein